MTEQNDVAPKINSNPNWQVVVAERVSACDNRPGLKKIYVTVLDNNGLPVPNVKVRFDTEPSRGIAYDHPNIYSTTDDDGYIEWDHLGKPTRYVLIMEDDNYPLIENIRTDLGNEYCRPPGSAPWSGWRPVNKPGWFSYRIAIRRRW